MEITKSKYNKMKIHHKLFIITRNIKSNQLRQEKMGVVQLVIINGLE